MTELEPVHSNLVTEIQDSIPGVSNRVLCWEDNLPFPPAKREKKEIGRNYAFINPFLPSKKPNFSLWGEDQANCFAWLYYGRLYTVWPDHHLN